MVLEPKIGVTYTATLLEPISHTSAMLPPFVLALELRNRKFYNLTLKQTLSRMQPTYSFPILEIPQVYRNKKVKSGSHYP